MKKIILFIFTFTLLITQVQAEIITKENKKGEYLRQDIITDEYEYNDTSDIMYGEYSDYYLYDDNLHLDIPYYDYEVKDVVSYYKLYDIDYVKLLSPFGQISFDDIVIYYNNEPIHYQIVDSRYFDQESHIISENGYIMFKLEHHIPADDKIKIALTAKPLDSKQYQVHLFNQQDLSYPVLRGVGFTFQDAIEANTSWVIGDYDTSREYYASELPSNDDFYEANGIKKGYRYREILTYHYNIINEDNNNDIPTEITSNPIVDEPPLINLLEYNTVAVPNTKKDNFWDTIITKIIALIFCQNMHV